MLHIQFVPSWKMMVGGLPEIHQWIHYSLYWMHRGKTNHKHYSKFAFETNECACCWPSTEYAAENELAPHS